MALVLAFLLLSYVTASPVLLQEGETQMEQVKADEAFSVFRIQVEEKQEKAEISVLLNLYSGETDPVICVKRTSEEDTKSCIWEDASSRQQVSIPADKIKEDDNFYVVIGCSACRYSITYRYSKPVVLKLGTTLTELVQNKDTNLYVLRLKEEKQAQIRVLPVYGEVSLSLFYTEAADGKDVKATCEESWDGGMFCPIHLPGNYRILVKGEVESNQGELVANQLVFGEVEVGKYRNYLLKVENETALVTILLTQFSGNSDVYVSAKDIPTKDKYDLKANSMGNEYLFISSEDRKSLDREKGDYHIAVYGKTTGSYSLEVRIRSNRPKPLIAGMREYGAVQHGQLTQYLVFFPEGKVGRIQIQLQALEGNPDLYAKHCLNKNCTMTQEDVDGAPQSNPHLDNVYVSKNIIEDHLYLPYTDSTTPRAFLIGVLGESVAISRFFLDVNIDSKSITALSSSVPYSTWMPSSGTLYFSFFEHEVTTEFIEFVLTPISGNPDLYVSRTIKRVKKEDAEKRSEEIGVLVDKVEYKKSSKKMDLRGSYYMTVESKTPSSFSFLVHEGRKTVEPVELLPGIAQTVDCPYSEDTTSVIRRFFFYQDVTEPKDIRILLTNERGVTDLKITCGETTGNDTSTWPWETSSNSLRLISKTDPDYCKKGFYTIYAETTMTLEEPGLYRILYTAGESIAIGTDWALNDAVEMNQTNFYRWRVPLPQSEARLKIQTSTGRVETCLSFSSEVQRPSARNYDLKWKGYRSQMLNFSEPEFAKKCGNSSSCTVFFGVTGVTNANYTVVAETEEQEIKNILIGQTISAISRGQYSYFVAHFKKNKPLYILVQPVDFDVNLYVNIQNDTSDRVFPTKENSAFKSENSLLFAESITIPSTESSKFCSSWSCSVLISVYCFYENCKFDIEVDQSNVPVLEEAKARTAVVSKDTPIRVRFYCPYDNTTILVSLTRLSGADPDLYISRKDSPDLHTYEWKSETYGNDYIVISSTDQQFEGQSMRGFYNVAVISQGTAHVTVAYTTEVSPALPLIPGVPQVFTTPAKSISYFYLPSPGDYDLVISLTPLQGRAALLVNTQNLVLEDVYEQLPTPTNNTWSTPRSGLVSELTLRISKSDPKFCKKNCNYIIGVSTGTKNCTYSLVARSDLNLVFLQSGVPTRDTVKSAEFDYYAFALPSEPSKVHLSLAGLSGDVDLYIGVKVPLTTSNYLKKSSNKSGLESLDVGPEDLMGAKYLYIGVFGFKAGSYILLLTTNKEEPISIIDGWSGLYAVRYDPSDFLIFEHVHSNESVTCHVTPQTHFFALDVFSQSASSKSQIPGPESFDQAYNSSSLEYDEYVNQLTFQLESGRSRVAIHGKTSPRHGKEEFLTFSLFCTVTGDFLYMKAGAEDHGVLTPLTDNQTYMIETPQSVLFEAYLTSCAGTVKLEASIPGSREPVEVIQMRYDVQMIMLSTAVTMYALKVSLVEADRNLESAIYHLVTRYYEKGKQPPKTIYPGNEGAVQAIVSSGTINLVWKPPFTGEEVALSPETVRYRIYTSSDPSLTTRSYCGLQTAVRQHKVKRQTRDDLSEAHFEFDVPKTSELYVTVIAIVDLPEYGFYFSYIPYETVQVESRLHDEEEGVELGVLEWAIAFVLILMLIGAVCACRKKRAQPRMPEYEMMNPGNSATS